MALPAPTGSSCGISLAVAVRSLVEWRSAKGVLMHQVADAVSSNATWPTLPVRAVKGITVVVAVTCMALALWMQPMSFRDFRMEALLELFAKLIAIALFIERTVEVLWRRGADP